MAHELNAMATQAAVRRSIAKISEEEGTAHSPARLSNEAIFIQGFNVSTLMAQTASRAA